MTVVAGKAKLVGKHQWLMWALEPESFATKSALVPSHATAAVEPNSLNLSMAVYSIKLNSLIKLTYTGSIGFTASL